MEWTVVLVIIALVGLFATVSGPIIKLNSSITELNTNLKHNTGEIAELKTQQKDQQKHAHESHQKLWEHNSEQDEKINDHETRLGILEKKDV